MADHPWMEVLDSAKAMIELGCEVYQKFTCEKCKSHQTIDEPNKFYTSGKCEECGHITDLVKAGHNYMIMRSFIE